MVNVPVGANIQNYVNADPPGTVFQLASGNYAGQSFSPQSNDQFIGAAGGGTVFNGGGQSSPMVTNGGQTGVVFSNITTTNFNTPARVAPIMTGSGWQIINVTSTNNGGAGLYVGGPNNLVQGGSFSNNGQEGIDGSNADGSKIIGVTANRNNTDNYDQGWDAGGIKITNTNGLTITGSTVSNNNGNGIWADINSDNWTITDNGVANNNGNGIMYEISHNATISGNLVAGNTGSQVYVSNSDGVTVSGNGVEDVPGATINGAATGAGIAIWTNSGRGDDPAGQPYLSDNDTATGNTIVGPASTTGVFSVLGTMANDNVGGNTFLPFGSASTQAAARQAAATLPALSAPAVTAAPGAATAPTAPQTSIPGGASAVPSGAAPVQAADLPNPPALPAGTTVPAGYTSGSASDPPVSAAAQAAAGQGNAAGAQANTLLAGVLALMPPSSGSGPTGGQ